MLRLDTLARHGRTAASWSHLACCTVCEADTIENASYVANSPWRPVSVYASSHPWQLCSLSTSITRPDWLSFTSPGSRPSIHARSETSKIAPSRFEFASSGENSRKLSRVPLVRCLHQLTELARR